MRKRAVRINTVSGPMEDFVITKGGDAGRLVSEVAEIVFNPEVSDYEYFLSRKRYFERLKTQEPPSVEPRDREVR